MKIPKRVKIGAYIYQVELSEDIGREGDCYGSTHHSSEKIFIDPYYSKTKQKTTFIHELLHAIFEVSGLNHRFAAKEKDALPTSEDVVRETATLLNQVLEDNPGILK